jgi:hypothetical protein
MYPLTASVRSILATQKALQDAGLTGAPPSLLIVDGKAHGPLVFSSTTGGALNPSYVTHHFAKLLTAAGIEPLRMHDLRHGFVSALFADGCRSKTSAGSSDRARPRRRGRSTSTCSRTGGWRRPRRWIATSPRRLLIRTGVPNGVRRLSGRVDGSSGAADLNVIRSPSGR